MPNLLQQINDVLQGEPVEAAVIGPFGGYEYEPSSTRDGDLEPGDLRYVSANLRGAVLPWDEAAPLLNYEYDDGYGGVDCHGFWLWTPASVLFLGSYDGSSWVQRLPRNPTLGTPQSIGGG